MLDKIYKLRDTSREVLHGISHGLGETLSIKPDSVSNRARANAALQLDIPLFRNLLPYESMDDQGFFINHTTAGFGLHIAPMPGADVWLMKSMSELIKNKLPAGVDCTVMLYKHHYLANTLQRSFAPVIEKGGIYAELARKSLAFHVNAIKNGYANGRNIPAQLVDYRGFIFLSLPQKAISQEAFIHLRESWESELKVAGFAFERMDKEAFCVLLRTLVSPDLGATQWPEVQTHDGLIREAIANPSSAYEIEEDAITVTGVDMQNNPVSTRIINCEISSYPKEPFALWQTPDLFANLLRAEHGVQCPFLISFTFRGTNQEKMKALAKKRASSLASNSNGIQRFLNPTLADEQAEWQQVYEQSTKDNLDLMPTFYNLMLFTTPDKEREHIAKAISSYRQMGFTLTQSRCRQWLRFLGSLPFVLSEGLFKSLQTMGLTKKLSHHNIANLLPLIADAKGSRQGLLLPTYRHQAFFFDPFDDKHLPITNYNRLTVASSGSGKSFFQLALLQEAQSRDHLTFVIDLGDSYKHLCEMVGGRYIDASTLSINPFTLFDFEGVTEMGKEQINDYVQIRDLLAVMASPHAPLDAVQNAWLLRATLIVWKRHGNNACIDDVIGVLREILTEPESKDDQRLKDVILLLDQYGKEGAYGAMFNGKTPLLNDSNFIVLEMGGFSSNPELLTIAMFVMIVIIQGQFYHTDRRIKKQCNIDEAWRFLLGENPVAANLIATGFRTARKHNGGFSVNTQFLGDTTETLQGRAIAASSDTKIIMRQGDFTKYMSNNPDAFDPLQVKMIDSFGEAHAQGFSSMMLQFGTCYSFHRYFSDPFSRILFSTSGDEFGEVEALTAQGYSMAEAVDTVVKARYGETPCA